MDSVRIQLVTQQFKKPFLLSQHGIALTEEVFQSLVIYKYLDGVPEQVWTPFLDSEDDCHHLFVIDR